MSVSPLHASTLDEPIPFGVVAPRERFPVDALPSIVAAMVDAVATATQTDPGMGGTCALSVLAAASGGHVNVEAWPGWVQPVCLYTAAVAPPGERKSAVQRDFLAPLDIAEAALIEKTSASRIEAEVQRDVAVKAAEAARAKAGRANPEERAADTADAVSLAEAAERITLSKAPRLYADDCTPEAVASLLAEQHGRLAILSAEGGIFDTIAGRYSNTPNLDVFLKAHDADQIRVDRRNRDPEHVANPALTIGLMVQPDVVQKLGALGFFKGRGLSPRFLFAWPESMVGRRVARTAPVPSHVRDSYTRTVADLVAALNELDDPVTLTLTDDAQDVVEDMSAAIEPQLDKDCGRLRNLVEWGAKYVGRVVRIAALLHLAQHGRAAYALPVTAETVGQARRIGEYYLEQAVHVFGVMAEDDTTRNARYLLRRLSLDPGPGEVISQRDMLRTARHIKSVADLSPLVQLLVERGWLIDEPAPDDDGPRRGRPPSPKYRIHPSADPNNA